MSLRFQNLLSIAFVIVVVGLLGLTFYVSLQSPEQEGRFTGEAVRGVTAVFDGKPYTLNFDQQQKLLVHLDRSQPYAGSQALTAAAGVPLQFILIHRFENADDEIQVMGWKGEKLVFRPKGEFQAFVDSSDGEIYRLLKTAHD